MRRKSFRPEIRFHSTQPFIITKPSPDMTWCGRVVRWSWVNFQCRPGNFVGCVGLNGPVRQYFSLYFTSVSGRLPERGRKKREMIDERKKCPNNPHSLRQYFSLYRAGPRSAVSSASDSRARGPGFDTRSATYFRFSFR